MCTDYAQGDVGAVIRISWDVNFQGTPRLGKRLIPPHCRFWSHLGCMGRKLVTIQWDLHITKCHGTGKI